MQWLTVEFVLGHRIHYMCLGKCLFRKAMRSKAPTIARSRRSRWDWVVGRSLHFCSSQLRCCGSFHRFFDCTLFLESHQQCGSPRGSGQDARLELPHGFSDANELGVCVPATISASISASISARKWLLIDRSWKVVPGLAASNASLLCVEYIDRNLTGYDSTSTE